MRYELRLMDNVAGVGCFTAHPVQNLSFNEMLDHLRQCPFDDFMHNFVLQGMSGQRARKVEKLMDEVLHGNKAGDMVLAALLYETCLAHARFRHLLPRLAALDPLELDRHTPAVHIRSSLLQDQELHTRWIELFRENITRHAPLPSPEEAGMPLPVAPEACAPDRARTAGQTLKRLRLEKALPAPRDRKPLAETIALALDRLEKAGALLSREMAHKASLSPHSRLHMWAMQVRTDNGRMQNHFQGMQTAYGRGLSVDAARASYSMEMAERWSAYASVGKAGVLGYARPYPLFFGSADEAASQGEPLDLSRLRLEVPYAGQRLHWMEGHAGDGGATRPVLVPAQLVFLFCNLDEPSLVSALGSTGLAAGNTMAEAKVAAICEHLERDAETVTPFDMRHCFRIASSDPEISCLLDDYAACGIHPWFFDMTPQWGVPTYKSIVLGRRGDVNKGTGCGLCGSQALISALTETQYPFPGPAGMPAPDGLPVRNLEDLPDFSTGSADGDLLVLEQTLAGNDITPVYVDLTRKDLGIPAVRAILPGLEFISDFDQFSRVSPRLAANYLRLFDRG